MPGEAVIFTDSMHTGYSEARAILSFVDDSHYPEVIRFNPSASAYKLKKEEMKFVNGQKLLRNFPNPFSDQTVIELQVDEKLNNPLLVVCDVIGKTVLTTKLNAGFNTVSPDFLTF